MKKFVLVAAALCVSSCQLLVKAEDASVGIDATIRFIETFTVMGECEPGQLARKEVEQKRTVLEQEIQEEMKKFEKSHADYLAKSSTMTDKARESEEKKLMKKDREIKAMPAEKEEEFKLEVQLVTERLALDMEAAVVEYAQQENIDIVCDKMGRTIYVSDKFDVTDKVIKKVNERHHIKIAENKKAEQAAKGLNKTTESVKLAENKSVAAKTEKAKA